MENKINTNNIVYGIHTINIILKYKPQNLLKVFIAEEIRSYRLNIIIYKLNKLGINVNFIKYKLLNKILKGIVHQGIIAYTKPINYNTENYLLKLIQKIPMPLLLMLDSITDPQNLGACIRCADAVGVNAIIIPNKKSVKLNSTVRKTSSGAAENIPIIYVKNLLHTILLLKKYNIKIIGTSVEQGKILYQSKFNIPLVLIMGSENKGIKNVIYKNCDELINIPMFGLISSLNVSVATGICLYEIMRQRMNY